MLNLKKIWGRRFRGWAWLLTPALAGWGWSLLRIEEASLSAWEPLLVMTLVLAGVLLGFWQLDRSHGDLLHTARQLANGRLESRADAQQPGASGALAEQLNQLARVLSAQQDQQAQASSAVLLSLRQRSDQLGEDNALLRQRLRDYEAAAHWQADLLSNLSHELRTPLTAILGYADLLQHSSLTLGQGQQLLTLERSARGMLDMINDLLDWGRIEAGQLRLNTEPFDLVSTVEETTALLAPLAYDKSLELVHLIYHDVPRQLQGDAQRLRQILTNLISNAIKFTAQGEVVIRVMRERDEGGKIGLRLSVTDTGMGISAEDQARLFQPFRQTGHKLGGSGLGLSITRKLAELMGGSIELSSTPGAGSSFSALLPFAANSAPDEEALPDPRLREHQVWLCEPHDIARLALCHWLEFWGLRVNVQSSLADMQKTLNLTPEQRRPQLILLGASAAQLADNSMLEGLRLLAQSTSVLVLTSSVSLEIQSRLRAAGAAACLAKSAGHQALKAQLLQLLGLEESTTLLRGQLLLVADNNPSIRRYVVALAEAQGLSTLEANNGTQALQLWEQLRPGYVLLDARMPGLDGAQSAAAIRARETAAGPRSCIIAISAHLEPAERADLLSAGADAILLKPFDGPQLLKALSLKASDPPASGAAVLVEDLEMLRLLIEELPLQCQELQQAMTTDSLETARNAAHQLHGTASFYHLAPLKNACDLLEKKLIAASHPADCADALARVNQQLEQTLRALTAKLQST